RKRACFIKLDLEDLSSIKTFTEEFKTKFNKLDILINNAGGVYRNFILTKNNIEATLQINTISPMLLTQGLLDILHNSKGRIINIASRSYQHWKKSSEFYENLDIETYDFEKRNYQSYIQYCY